MNLRSLIAHLSPEIVAVACIFLQALIVFHTPQGMASDQLLQLTAVHQYIAGTSPSINHLVTVDEADLTRDVANWIDWWPPGYPILAFAGASAGLADGTSSRIISFVCASIGALLWLTWSRRIGARPFALYALAIAIPWARYTSAMSLETSAEAMLFAFAPALLLLADSTRTRASFRTSAALGLLGGTAFLCKYSAGVTFAAALAAAWLTSEVRPRRRLLPAALALTIFVAIAAAWTIASAKLGSGRGNSALDTLQLRGYWALNPVIALADVGLSVADLGAPLARLTLSIGIRVAVGLGLLATVVALIGIPRLQRQAFTVVFVSATALLLAGIWTFSGAADYDHRHAMQAGLALLPLMAMRLDDRPLRRGLVCAVAALLLASIAYGGASLVAKAMRNAIDSGANDRLWGQFLTWDGAGRARRAADEFCSGAPQIWFVVDRLSALRIGGRVVGMGAEFWSNERLRLQRHEPERYCIVMLLPDAMESDGRGARLRGTFTEVQRWQRVSVEGSAFPLRIGLRPSLVGR